MKNVVRTIGLDWDDFIVKSRDIKTQQHIAVAREAFKRTISVEDVDAVWGQGLKVEMGHYYGAIDPWNPTEEEHADHLAKYNARSHEFPKKLLPGAKVSHERLVNSGLPVFVVTSLLTGNTRGEMAELGIDPASFLFVHGSDITPAIKPNKEAFDPAKRILAGMGINPAETLYGGDALSDADGSTAAGLQFVGVPSGRVTAQTFAERGYQSVPTLTDFTDYALSHAVL